MNRQTLSDATSLHDAAVPIYLMQEIAAGTKASERDAEKTVDFLLGRLAKTNLIVKLKALQIISFCIREGDPVFVEIIREEEGEITPYLQFSGPPDPVMGDERYRRIRVASQEVMVCLNDGVLPRRDDPPPAPPQQAPAPYSDTPHNAYGNSSNAPHGQSGGYGGSSQGSKQWGNTSSGSSASRPAPYSDGPSGPSYGGPQQGQYGGQPNGGYSQSNHQNTGYGGGGGYGNDVSQQHQQQSSGFGSWANPAAAPAFGAPKSAGGGMWSNAGYQKSAAPPPSYGASVSSRDSRPTVLVGHNLSFPKAASHGNSSLIGGVSGTSSSVYGGPSGSTYGGQGGGGYGGSSGPGGYGNSGGYGGNSGSNMGGNSGFGGVSSRQTPSYVENMNRMLSANGPVGFSGGMQGLHDGPTTKLGKAVVGLKKISVEAKDRWDRRNMDKSIGASLADHDELNAGPTMMDRGYYQPQSLHQGTGGKDTSGEYERGLIDSLCASVGLARAPPAEALKRFVDLAQTLDVQTIGDILLDKLEDSVWQVRLKALHVVIALLESPGAAPYMELFEDNAGVFEELQGDAKPTVASKAQLVLRVLGLVDDNAPEPKRQTARATPSRPAAQQTSGEVDFLGLDGLSISSPTQPAQASHANLYGSPPPGPAATHHAPEVSLLDGFDMVPQNPGPQYQQQQQLAYQQQQQPTYQQQQQQAYQHQQQQQQAHHLQQQQQAYPQQQQQHQPYLLSPRQQQQSIYGDLLVQSPPHQPLQAPGDDRSKTLSNFGKDLFTIANSPRGSSHNSTSAPVNAADRSAFNFM